MRKKNQLNAAIDGFTLIEVLVALSILAAAAAAIGGMIAVNARGVRSIQAHLKRLEAARTIAAALPERDQLGSMTGKIGGDSWRVDVSPLPMQNGGPTQDLRWVPQTVRITARSPNGAAIELSTISLHRSAGN